MSQPDYPLIRALGVEVHDGLVAPEQFPFAAQMSATVILAADLERVLESAPVMKVFDSGDGYHKPDFIDKATHTARLVCVQSIVRESEEREVLRKLLSLRDEEQVYCREGDAAFERARKLLERGE